MVLCDLTVWKKKQINTVGVPQWLKPAVQTEFYIKAGLVIMGFSVLFSNIVNFGLYGLGIAWIVTPVVILSLAVSISIIFTVLMMVFEPVIIRMTGLGEVHSEYFNWFYCICSCSLFCDKDRE